MPLHLITGRANAGKTGVLHGHVLASAHRGASATLLLPSGADIRRARAEISLKAPVGVRISTLDTWAQQLWAKLGDGRVFVTPLVRRASVTRAIDESELSVVAASSRTAGFIDILARVVARLCNSHAPTQGLPREMRELQNVIQRYESIIEALGLIEPARASTEMAGKGLPGLGLVAVNRFSDLSEAQELLLLAAAQTSDVRIGLTWERGFPATEALTPLVDRLVELGGVVTECPPASSSDELGRLEQRLYRATEGPQLQPTGRVELCTAAGEEAEIEIIADAVGRSLQLGVPASRIAVCFRRPGPRTRRLAASLEERGVLLDVDVVETVRQTDLGKALLGLLKAARGEGSRSDVLAFAASPYGGVDGDELTSLDRRWRRSRASDANGMLDAVARVSGQAARAIRAARDVTIRPADVAAVGIWKDLADCLLESAFATRQSGSGTTARRDLADAAGHRSIMQAVQEAAHLDGAISGVDLATSLADIPVSGRPGERATAVQALDATRARSRRFDVLIVGGLTAGEFSAEKPEPLQARIERSLDGRGGTEERLSERLLFYTLVTRARKKLVLVRQSSDSAGEALRPSVFWEDVADLYVPAAETGERTALPEGLPQPALMLSDIARAVPAFTTVRRKAREAIERGEDVLHRPLSTELTTVWVESLAARDSFTVTELETYAQCPYRWFVERAVRPRDIDVALDAREMGTRAHQMLALFYQRLTERLGLKRLDPSSVEDGLLLFDEIAAEVEADRRDGGSMTLAEEFDMAVARARARAVVEDDATFLPGYAPAATEWEASVELASEAGAVTVRGKVDRVDVGPAGVVVTDYKLSKVSGLAAWDRQRLLQIPLYASIAGAQMELPVAGGIYRSLRSLEARGFWRADLDVPLGEGHGYGDAVDEVAVQAAIDAALEVALASVAGIAGGVIAPQPAHKDACAYCSAAGFCPEVMQ